ncbi:beta strand repeat-containing protein, partial [Methanobrevibacter curvatus]|uniref:beta strand repeat-containing protein n=1 Tax=Methanobrevibacter curvatus TaxID=49547 RepID=UPI000A81901C
MINKHFKVIVTALVLLLVVSTVSTISAVSAAEFTETTSGNLNQAVTNAQNSGDVSDTITLNPGTYTGNNNKNIDVNGNNKNLTVQGNGDSSSVILDAESNGIFFNITGNNLNVTFKNLTFKNGKNTNNGGAITNNIASNQLSFVNCIFINNIATNGGAIYSNGTLSVTNSNFINNSASGLGDSIFIADSSPVSIINNVFTTNVSSGVVEVVSYDPDNVGLENNAYYFVGNKKINVNLTNITVLNNRVTVFADVFNVDGLINNGDVAFYVDGKFSGRVLVVNGKASYSFNSPNGVFEVYGDYVHTNLTADTPSTHGINSLNFSVNYTSLGLLSVPLPTTGTMYWVDPVNGNDSWSGLNITTARKTLNSMLGTAPSGSIIIMMPGTYSAAGQHSLSVGKDITFIGNETDGREVIISPAGNRFMTTTTASPSVNRNVNLYNFRIQTTTISGTISIGAYANLVLDNLRVSGKTNGNGVLYINNSNVKLTVNNSDFNNLAGTNGTFIFANHRSNLSIIVDNSNVSNLQSTGYGVAICINDSNNLNLIINNSNFKNLRAPNAISHGGLLYCSGNSANVIFDNLNMTNSSVNNEGSVAFLTGGGTTAATYSNIIIRNSNFKDGNSSYGAIDTNLGWITQIYYSTFDNFRSNAHGAVLDNDGREIIVVGSNFTNCYTWNISAGQTGTHNVPSGGGVIYNHAAFANTITNSSFINNYARYNGGAIVALGDLTIDNCRFIGNSINGSNSSYGGAIYNNGSSLIIINNSYFDNNDVKTTAAAALSGGGAVATNNGQTRVYNSVFVNNDANGAGTTSYGGVFSVSGTGSIVADNCTFENNSAKSFGGVAGTTNAGSSIIITNSNLVNNFANGYGGALGSAGGQISIYNSLLTGNRATTSYGGVAGVNNANAVILIYNSQGHNNYATTFGGVLGANGGSIVLNGSVFTNNSAGSYGGVAGIAQGS